MPANQQATACNIDHYHRIAVNFRRVQFLWMGDLITFHGSIFADAHNCTVTSLYKRAYFAGLTFAVHESTVKTAKIGSLENFPLYGISGKTDSHEPRRCAHF